MLLGPWRIAAEAARGWFGHPFSPLTYSPIARRIAASSDLFLRVTQRYEKPAWNIDSTVVDGKEVAVETVTELDKPFCKLIHFRRALEGKGRRAATIRACCWWRRSRATTRRCCATRCARCCPITRSGSPTGWTRAWCRCRAGPFHLADYVDYVREFITLLTDPRQPNLNVISVCQPTVPVLCAVALMAQDGEPQSAEDHGDDGRADRRAQEPDRGQQPRHAASPIRGSSRT